MILTQAQFNELQNKMKNPAKRWVGKEFNKDWMLEEWQKPIKKAEELFDQISITTI